MQTGFPLSELTRKPIYYKDGYMSLCMHAQSRPTLFDPMFCSPPSSSVLEFLWNFPGKNTGVGCHFLLQGIFLTQGSNPCLLHWHVDFSPLHPILAIPRQFSLRTKSAGILNLDFLTSKLHNIDIHSLSHSAYAIL